MKSILFFATLVAWIIQQTEWLSIGRGMLTWLSVSFRTDAQLSVSAFRQYMSDVNHVMRFQPITLRDFLLVCVNSD